MSAGAATRKWWTTALVAAAGGAVGGLFFVGRPRIAGLALLLQLAAIVPVVVFGLPAFVFDVPNLLWLGGSTIVSVAVALVLRRRQRPSGWWSRWYAAILIGWGSTFVAVLAVRTFLLEPFSISGTGGSMAPALVGGDWLFASKWPYSYGRYSFPGGFADFEGRILGREPRRGDIVVFRYPRDPSLVYVKRLVGLPGERIRVAGGVLHIDGVPVRRERTGENRDERMTGVTYPVDVVRETLPGGAIYDTLDLGDAGPMDETPEYSVPDGHYFVLGDYRDNSADSRVFGFVPYDHLVGRAERIFWNSRGLPYSDRASLASAVAE